MSISYEALTRYINACAPSELLALAKLYYRSQGYQVRPGDGTGDGGIDLWIVPPAHDPAAVRGEPVQLSTQKKWQEKVRNTARQIPGLGLAGFQYFTSQRIPEQTFLSVQQELRVQGVFVQRVDAQLLGSHAVENGYALQVLELLGIPHKLAQPTSLPDRRAELAHAFVFFGDATGEFRARLQDRAVLLAAAEHGAPVEVDALVDRALDVLGQSREQRRLVRGAVDRLRQTKQLEGSNGTVKLAPAAAEQHAVAHALRARAWADLAREVDGVLRPHLGRNALTEERMERVLNALGAIALTTGQATREALASTPRVDQLSTTALRTQLGAVWNVLSLLDLTQVEQNALFVQIVEVVRESTIARALAAGELYRAMAEMPRSQHLERALGWATGTGSVVLDASIAMPLLCGRLHGRAPDRFSHAAVDLADLALAHGFVLELPSDWLEECAAHLVMAWRDYADLIDIDPSLRASTNAYVSHYVGTASMPSHADFAEYLASFGLTSVLRDPDRDFVFRRKRVERALARLYAEYQVKVIQTPVDATSTQRTEEQWAYTLDKLGRQRSIATSKHDARVLTWLMEHGDGRMLCTWDHVLLEMLEALGEPSLAILPDAMADLLALLANAGPGRLVRPHALALMLTEDEVRRSAEIWDQLVQIKDLDWTDAKLRQEAKRFRDAFLARNARTDAGHVKRAWASWRENSSGQ